MKLIDLSHNIDPSTPVFPGSPSTKIDQISTISADSYSEVHIHINSHTGTHVDFPAHIIEGGKAVDDFPVNHFYGRAMIISVDGRVPIQIDHLEPYAEAIATVDFLLLHTGWSNYWGDGHYFVAHTYLVPEAAKWLCGFMLKGVGIDSLSVDPMGSLSLPAHRLLLEKDIVIIENLTNLAAIDVEEFDFSCLPLKIVASDGSPVRAVAIIP